MNNTLKSLLRPIDRPIKAVLRPILYSRHPPICENVVMWALGEMHVVKRIHEPFFIELPIPRGSEKESKAFSIFDAHSKIGLSGQFLVCLPGGGVPGAAGFVTMPKGEFIIESVCRPQYLLDSLVYKSRLPLKKRRLEGDWYSLVSYFNGNYGHWFWEDLPRLFAALPHLPPSTRFLVPRSMEAFQSDSLFALGISSDRLIAQLPNTHSQCERLWFATALGNQDWCVTASDVVREMRLPFIKAFGQAGQGPERIFVSRGGLKRNKRLLNEDDLIPILEKLNFAIIRPESLSLKEQISTFQNAKVVLGAFGAGLTNIFFCPSPAMILELQDSIFAPRYWYWKLATILGHEWRCCVGQSQQGHRLTWADWPSASFNLDAKDLAEFLECALENKGQNLNPQWWNKHPSPFPG